MCDSEGWQTTKRRTTKKSDKKPEEKTQVRKKSDPKKLDIFGREIKEAPSKEAAHKEAAPREATSKEVGSRESGEKYVPPNSQDHKICKPSVPSTTNLGDDKLLNSYWRVWKHATDNSDWSLESYDKIYTINSVGSFWKFFNNFNLLNKINNQLFIMREEVAPIWEDVNNKNGGICSIKIDHYNNRNRNEVGSEIMLCICLLVMNETLIMKNQIVNGVSYAVKNKSIFIKIWVNSYKDNGNFMALLPITFLKKIEAVLKNMDKQVALSNNKVSVQYKQIIPEY